MKTGPNLFLLTQPVLKKHTAILVMLLFVNLIPDVSAQSNEDSKKPLHFSGVITATNNGISVIPSFSLGKPAVMFELSLGGERLSFDPQLRFSTQGKPWSFVFWWRYKIVNNDNFQFRVGAHPAFLFSTNTYIEDGAPAEVIKTNRFLAMELAPVFVVSDKIKLMPYMIRAHGFDPGTRNNLYLTFITSFSDLAITKNIRAGITPQVFFLKVDENSGYYVASALSVSHDKCPLSLGIMTNKKLKSEVESKDFIWNVSLVYTFDNNYKRL